MSLKKLYFILFFVFLSRELYSQEDTTYVNRVLQKNIIGKEFLFKQDQGSTRLKYLGNVKTKSGSVYKVINSTYVFGLYQDSQRASCRILLFDKSNKYIGRYEVGGIWYLPNSIEKNQLIFKLSGECNQTTKISFEEGIPDQLYVLCTKQSGDIFSFERV